QRSAPSTPTTPVATGQVVAEEARRVLGLVAVGAEILPVAAVGRVVVVVAVLVVDGQEVEVRRLELARTARADPAVQRERALAVAVAARELVRAEVPEEGVVVGGRPSRRLRPGPKLLRHAVFPGAGPTRAGALTPRAGPSVAVVLAARELALGGLEVGDDLLVDRAVLDDRAVEPLALAALPGELSPVGADPVDVPGLVLRDRAQDRLGVGVDARTPEVLLV